MANWVEVDWEKLNPPRQEQIDGVGVTVYFSPYDMPEAVKGEDNDAKDRFVIRFQYLGGEEPVEYHDKDKHIQLGIGKKTGRLHEILVDVKSLQAGSVMLKMQPSELVANEVKDAIAKFAKASAPGSATRGNYEAASEALQQRREKSIRARLCMHITTRYLSPFENVDRRDRVLIAVSKACPSRIIPPV